MNNFKFDFIAGLTVFLVAVPLCLGISLACGAPLVSGLLSGIIGGIVIGCLSDSNLSVSGPAAGLVSLILAGITLLGSFEAFLSCVALAGVLQILMGILKFGKLTRLIPHSVIEGMMAAIGIILIIKQFPVLIGNSLNQEFHGAILMLGLFSLILLMIWDYSFSYRYKLIPGSLVVVVFGMIVTIFMTHFLHEFGISKDYFVKIPALQSFNDFKSLFILPDWSQFRSFSFYRTAFVIALVASIESLLSINAIERLHNKGIHANKDRELIAQGFGNLISGLIGGLPMASVIVRSSVNLYAGATSKKSTIIHGFFILIMLILGSYFMSFVPLVSLAAILIFTGYKLAHPKHVLIAWKTSKIDFLAFIVTAALVVVGDLLVGVISGIALYYFLKNLKFSDKS